MKFEETTPEETKLEETGLAVSEAARQVLETMCFMDAGEIPGNGPLAPSSAASIGVQVEFQGYWTGRCVVEMPESCARTIAGNFMGTLDPDHVEAGVMIEMLCAFANMTCGGTITRLCCSGIVTLSPSHLICEWPEIQDAAANQSIERWLDTG